MKSKRMQEVEHERGQPIEQVLADLFQEHGTQRAVAADLGITQSTLSYWLLKLRMSTQTILVRDDV